MNNRLRLFICTSVLIFVYWTVALAVGENTVLGFDRFALIQTPMLGPATVSSTPTDRPIFTFTPSPAFVIPNDPYSTVEAPSENIPSILTQLAPTPTPSLSPTPILPPPPSAACYLAPVQFTTATNVRQLPSLESEVIGILDYTWYQIDHASYDELGRSWYLIRWKRDFGWVASWVVQLSSYGCDNLFPTPNVTLTPTITPTSPPPPTPLVFSLPTEFENAVGLYVARSSDNLRSSLYIIRQGDAERVITESIIGEISHPSISPDGNLVAYLLTSEQGTILRLIDLSDDTSSTILTSTPDLLIGRYQIGWSPNSRTLLLTLEDNQRIGSIYTLNIITRETSLLIGNAAAPAVSVDGLFIAFQSQGKIYVTRFDVIQPRLLPKMDNIGVCYSPVFSPNEEVSLWFTCELEGQTHFYLYDGELHLVNIPLASGASLNTLRNLSSLPGLYISFDDGNEVYVSRLNSNNEITETVKLINLKDKNVTELHWSVNFTNE